MVSRAPKGRSKVTNGRQLFIDGDARLKVSRRFRDVLARIATDLGGADRLSEGQKQIARRCDGFDRPAAKGSIARACRAPMIADRFLKSLCTSATL